MQVYNFSKIDRPLSQNHKTLAKVCLRIMYFVNNDYSEKKRRSSKVELTFHRKDMGQIFLYYDTRYNTYLNKPKQYAVIVSFSFSKESRYSLGKIMPFNTYYSYLNTSYRLSTNKVIITNLDTFNLTRFRRYNVLRKIKLGSD